ncbi:putative ferric-chelate reductase 1 homolog [Galendromus occidentalis]|uniref:Ferric-chelate reductase 1 homolog n=1 Tax=Galendromus occidentalis TaxID=34638 RepID=A0AAJ7SEK6_9ACAR|nr:putative ferric-chelate reductase 1 homolog [Galendromus occidentalis]
MLQPVVILLAASVPAWANSVGAPAEACLTLLPGHDEEPQTTDAPFRLEVSSRCNEVQLDLVGSETFKGFLINARLASDPGQIVPGTFSADLYPNAQAIDCSNVRYSGLTHTDPSNKTAIRAVWNAPDGFDDKIVFKGAVVKAFDEFWSNITSPVIAVKGKSATEPYKPEIEDDVYDKCGVTAGCTGLPRDCIDTKDCEVLLTYTEEPGFGYRFELATTAGENHYAAAAFSDDDRMGNDAVVECVDTNGNIEIRESWNKANERVNEVLPTSNIQKVSQKSEGGVKSCVWRRPYSTEVGGLNFDLKGRNYIFLASGDVSDQGGGKSKHDEVVASDRPVDLSAARVERVDDSHLWIQTHATLMTVAWLFTASIGIMLARHYKNVWEDGTPFGVETWFACHQLLMGLTLTFAIGGVLTMFYRFGNLFPRAGWHPILGMTSLLFGILQPIMAFFRSKPGTPIRSIFNCIHWFVGNTAYVFGFAAIVFAIAKADIHDICWFIYLLIAFIIVNVFCHVILLIYESAEDVKAVRWAVERKSPEQMEEISERDTPGTKFRRMMLGAYIAGLLLTVGPLIALLWTNGTELMYWNA